MRNLASHCFNNKQSAMLNQQVNKKIFKFL